jgi:hypothetical protein
MADRIKENDYSGPLILNILEVRNIHPWFRGICANIFES